MGTVLMGVEDFYRTLIAGLSAGDRLPSERAVALQLHTCRSTVRVVLVKLTAEKLVLPVHGKGYFKR